MARKLIGYIFILLLFFCNKKESNINTEGFYDNGNIKIMDSNHLPNGEVLEFYENGIIKEKGYYVNGYKEGLFYRYENNGDLKEIAVYQFDSLINFAYYDQNSNLIDKSIPSLKILSNSNNCMVSFETGILNSFSDTLDLVISHFDIDEYEPKGIIFSTKLKGRELNVGSFNLTPNINHISFELIDYIPIQKGGKKGVIRLFLMKLIDFDTIIKGDSCISYTFNIL